MQPITGPVAQMVERSAFNRDVAGSTPAGLTKKEIVMKIDDLKKVNSLVEKRKFLIRQIERLKSKMSKDTLLVVRAIEKSRIILDNYQVHDEHLLSAVLETLKLDLMDIEGKLKEFGIDVDKE